MDKLCVYNENDVCMFCGDKMSDPTAILEA
jgi:hypothetical protein